MPHLLQFHYQFIPKFLLFEQLLQTNLISLPNLLKYSALKLLPKLIGKKSLGPFDRLAAPHDSFELSMDVCEGLLEDSLEVDSDHAK